MFILDTDASKSSIGSVISQIQGDREVVIAYASGALSKEEYNKRDGRTVESDNKRNAVEVCTGCVFH